MEGSYQNYLPADHSHQGGQFPVSNWGAVAVWTMDPQELERNQSKRGCHLWDLRSRKLSEDRESWQAGCSLKEEKSFIGKQMLRAR
jgi:hypothetical protein